MNRVEKKEWVSDVHGRFLDSEIIVVTHYKGLTVAEISELRGNVREAGAGFKVTKNRLTKMALKDTEFEGASDFFTGPTAVAYSSDPVAAAKVISAFSKENEKLVIIGGIFGGNVMGLDEIKQLATLPSLDELRAKIIAMINTPATRVAGVAQAPAGQLARVFGAYGAGDGAAA